MGLSEQWREAICLRCENPHGHRKRTVTEGPHAGRLRGCRWGGRKAGSWERCQQGHVGRGVCDRAVTSPTFNKRLVFTLVCIPAVLPTTFFSALTCHGGGRGAMGGSTGSTCSSVLQKRPSACPTSWQLGQPNYQTATISLTKKTPDSPPGSRPAAPASASLAPPVGPRCLCHRHRPPSPTARSPQTYFGRRSQSPGEQFQTDPPPHHRAGPGCRLERK